MPNPKGVNGLEDKFRPPPAEVKAKLEESFQEAGMTYAKAAERLEYAWEGQRFQIAKNTLKQRAWSMFGFKGPKREWEEFHNGNPELAKRYIEEEMEQDVSRLKGVQTIKQQVLQKYKLRIPTDFVRQVMHQKDEEGFDLRAPGKHRARINRHPMYAAGPFEHGHADGNEKLTVPCGFPIYHIRDRFTSCCVWIDTRPQIRKSTFGRLFFLDAFSEMGGMFCHMTVDKGSESEDLTEMLRTLRLKARPDLDVEQYPVCHRLPSTRNTVSESWNKQLGDHCLKNLHQLLANGMAAMRCHLTIDRVRVIYYWIWTPVVRNALDRFVRYWHHHTIRKQKDKRLDCGMTPLHSLETAASRGYVNCIIPLKQEWLDEMRAEAMQEIRHADDLHELEFFTNAQHEVLNHVWATDLQAPEVTESTGWEIFRRLRQSVLDAENRGDIPRDMWAEINPYEIERE